MSFDLGTTAASGSPSVSARAALRTSWAPDPSDLVEIYHRYRRHQVHALLDLVPPETWRPLYRAARSGRDAPREGIEDPLSVLRSYVESLLPLPPFRVWCADLLRSPEAHLDEPWMVDARPGPRAPLPLATRTERLAGASWDVDLIVHHAGGCWRGHLSFRAREETIRSHRTGDIFREEGIEALRERFLEFDRATLEAFLRSVRP